MKLLPTILAVVAICGLCIRATPLGTRNNYNVSLENPALFSLHWQMLEKNSTSGCKWPMRAYAATRLKLKDCLL